MFGGLRSESPQDLDGEERPQTSEKISPLRACRAEREQEKQASFAGQEERSASDKASGNANGGRIQKREGQGKDKNVGHGGEGIDMNDEETKAENGEWKVGSVYPEESRSTAEEICTKCVSGIKLNLNSVAEWCENQGFMGQNKEETKDQNLGDQVLQMRVTSGKRGKPPQQETLVQHRTMNTNKIGVDVGVQELDRLKLDITDAAQRASAPMRGQDRPICRQAGGEKNK